MRVLVTGGSGVIGEGLIPQLIERGYQVRLLARGAEAAARTWSEQVESFPADVTDPSDLRGAADDCDAVIHITGIVSEQPPDLTFARVNVEGTRHVRDEATRAGVRRFIFVSSLGAAAGASAYHQSKRDGERLAQEFAGEWLVIRPGNVYGPGDEVISKFLSMYRSLPAVPVIGTGAHRFQPIWHVDLGRALATAVAAQIPSGIYEVAGDEVTTTNELLEKFATLTRRSPLTLPIPEVVARLGAKAADAIGVTLPINEQQVQMLLEENVLQDAGSNALQRVFGVVATPLDRGLALLTDLQPEQQPGSGVGRMERKRFAADINGSTHTPESLMKEFRLRCTEVMPLEFAAEPGTPQVIAIGVTLTASLPLRGHIQIRVVECEPRAVTFATLRGHPLAGVVRFTAEPGSAQQVRFAITVTARAATVLDWLALNTVAGVAQNATWRTVVEQTVALSGGTTNGIEEESHVLTGEESATAEAWVRELIAAQKREEHDRQTT